VQKKHVLPHECTVHIKSFCHNQTEYIKEWVENCWDGGLVIVEIFSFTKKEEELDQQSLNFLARNKCLLKMHDQDTLIEQLP